MAFSDFGILLGDVSLFEVEHATKDPMKAQEKTLKKILKRNKKYIVINNSNKNIYLTGFSEKYDLVATIEYRIETKITARKIRAIKLANPNAKNIDNETNVQ